MLTIQELLDPTIIAAKWQDLPQTKLPYFSPTVFPLRRTVFTELSFLKGSRVVSAASRLSAFDADYTYVDRGNLVKKNVEMPFTREAYRLGEKERRRLNELLSAGNLGQTKTLVEELYNDVFALLDRAATFREFTAMSILQNASVVIASDVPENAKQTFEITYDQSAQWAAHNIIPIATPWEDPTAAPLMDIYKAIRFAQKETGTIITKVLLSSRLFEAMLASEKTNKLLFPNYENSIVTPARVNEYLSATVGRKIEVIDFAGNYRGSYLDEATGSVKEFINADRAILLPAGSVGSTYMGVTPAEDAKSYKPDLNVSVVDGGVAINQSIIKTDEPFQYKIIASQVALQSFEGQDDVYGLQVA